MRKAYGSQLAVLLIITLLFGAVSCAQATATPTKASAAPTAAPAAVPTSAPAAAPTRPAAAPAATASPAPAAAPAKPAVASAAQPLVRLTWATTAMGTPGYQHDVGLAGLIQKSDPNLNLTVSETAGSNVAMGALLKGEADFGMVTTNIVAQAYEGMGEYAGKADKSIRVLWAAFPVLVIIGVRADTDIQTIAQLTGRTMTVPAGSALEVLIRQSFAELGISPNWQPVGSALVGDVMKARKAEAFGKSGGFNDAVTMDLASSIGIRLLPVTKEDYEKVSKKYPGQLNYAAMPGGIIKGVDKDVPSLVYNGATITMSRVPVDVGYRMAQALYAQRAQAAKVIPGMEEFADFPKASIKYANVPLHAGAVKFFKEIGLSIPDNLVPPEAK